MADARRVVHDAETLKVLADPARLRILELSMGDYARSWTAKEFAGAINMPPKKIYYHLGLLEQQGLLEVRGTQIVNGIIEKHYGAGQQSITFQRGGAPGAHASTDGPADSPEQMGAVVTALFDMVHAHMLAGLDSGAAVMSRDAPDDKRMVVSYTTAGMSPEQAGEFRDALMAVIERFQAANTPGAPAYELLLAIHPRGQASPAPPQQ